jgi:hypothetical protein
LGLDDNHNDPVADDNPPPPYMSTLSLAPSYATVPADSSRKQSESSTGDAALNSRRKSWWQRMKEENEERKKAGKSTISRAEAAKITGYGAEDVDKSRPFTKDWFDHTEEERKKSMGWVGVGGL